MLDGDPHLSMHSEIFWKNSSTSDNKPVNSQHKLAQKLYYHITKGVVGWKRRIWPDADMNRNRLNNKAYKTH